MLYNLTETQNVNIYKSLYDNKKYKCNNQNRYVNIIFENS